VSLGSAILTVGLPIFGAGVLAVWGKHMWERHSAGDRATEEADRLLDEYQAKLHKDVLEAQFFPALRADIEASGRSVDTMLINEVTGGASENDVARAQCFYRHVAARQLAEAIRIDFPEQALVPA
jgi:hypothetical protein